MSLADVIRKGVATANRVTASLQPDVQHFATTSIQPDGTAVLSTSAVKRPGLVEDEVRRLVGVDGIERVSRTKVTFLSAVPVQMSDEFVLPDGTRTAVLAIERPPVDPAARGGGYLTVVYLGFTGRSTL